MAPDSPSASRATDDARRRKLLDTALTVFLRYGYRKTSMDEVARAAQVSRQGLYLHFATKEELFRATVQHTLESSLAAATAALGDTSLRLEARRPRPQTGSLRRRSSRPTAAGPHARRRRTLRTCSARHRGARCIRCLRGPRQRR